MSKKRLGRERRNKAGGLVSQDKKGRQDFGVSRASVDKSQRVKTYGRPNKSWGVGTPQRGVGPGVNAVNGLARVSR